MKCIFTITTILLITAFDYSCSQEKDIPERVTNKVMVDFLKEEITLTVMDNLALVEGVYYFLNNTDREIAFPVIFPFYVDSLSLYPHFIDAYMVSGNKTDELEFKHIGTGESIRLNIPLRPDEVTVWHLDYKQMLKAPNARYILTSTRAWGKPLKEATYYFIVPGTFTDVKVWPEADTIYTEGQARVYKAMRRNFMPAKDMEIFWERE